MIFDFHAHPTVKPFNSVSIYDADGKLPDTELWKERFRPDKNISKLALKLEKEVNYTSQTHINSLEEGGLNCMCMSLYPLERVFTVALKDYKKSLFYKIFSIIPLARLLLKLFQEPVQDKFFKLVGTLTGYDPWSVEALHRGNYNYYNQMVQEYDFLIENQNKLPDHANKSYEIANNYGDVNRIIGEGKIAFIVSVEGSNSFLGSSIDFDRLLKQERAGNVDEIIDLLTRNIREFKKKDYPPFIITFAHHQYNFLSGHSPSFIGIAAFLLEQEGETTVEGTNQAIQFYDVGIKSWGIEIIELILSKDEGRRTLIDTKHLSPQGRLKYHKIVKTKRANGDQIPIVQTHTGVNGRAKMSQALCSNGTLELDKKERREIPFFTGSINLFDDEIIDIVESDGMMGIMLDEKRIVGDALFKDTEFYVNLIDIEDLYSDYQRLLQTSQSLKNKPYELFKFIKKQLKRKQSYLYRAKRKYACEEIEEPRNPKKLKRLLRRVKKRQLQVDGHINYLKSAFHSILMNQFLHIVKIVDEASQNNPNLSNGKGWDHICIGSDYEGVINPIDIYFYAGDLKLLKEDLILFWKNAINNPLPYFKKYKTYLFGKRPEDYVEKILWTNSQEFLKKYFKEDYLSN